MDKKIAFFVITIFSVFLLSCSSQKEADNKIEQEEIKSEVISGIIMLVGNEPFTKLAVMVDDTTTYILNAPEEIEKELKMNQGNYYSITYKDNGKSPRGETIEVIKIEKTNK